MKKLALGLLGGILMLAVACGGGNGTTASTSSATMPGTEVKIAAGSYWEITPAQLHDFPTKDFFLVNADPAPMLTIAGTDLYTKTSPVSQILDKFPADKSKKIVVYCMSNINSITVATGLVEAGYTRVMDLKGGLSAWIQQGYSTVNYTPTP